MNSKYKIKKINEIFEFERALLLDYCEELLGKYTQWPHLRTRLLRSLSSERGLEKKVIQVLLEGEDDELLSE